MLKKIFPLLIITVLVIVIITVFLGRAKEQQMLTVYLDNPEQTPVPIKLGHYQDTQCGMPVEHLQDSAQVSIESGKTWFFDDFGCLALWLQNKSFADTARIWVYTRDTERWVDGRQAWYTLIDETPMGYGFGAHERNEAGRVDFETMMTKMLRGENLTDPYVRRELLGNH